MATYHDQTTRSGPRGWSRTRWLVLVGIAAIIAVVVALIVVYGGGSGGGGGY